MTAEGAAVSTQAAGDGAYLGTCAKHFAERAIGKCDDCLDVFCKDCLVPPLRKRQPTRCVDCALVAAGVRSAPRRAGGVNMSRISKRPNTGLF